jgi:hypothetical protein
VILREPFLLNRKRLGAGRVRWAALCVSIASNQKQSQRKEQMEVHSFFHVEMQGLSVLRVSHFTIPPYTLNPIPEKHTSQVKVACTYT